MLKNRKLLFANLTLAISILTTHSYAMESSVNSLYFAAESGWSSMASGHVPPYQFTYKKSFGYRASMGYLFLIPARFSIGPEISYGYYGLISYKNPSDLAVHYESTGWSLLANLKHATTNYINLYLKAGITDVFQHYDISGPGASITRGGFYQQKLCPTIIAAGSYDMTQHTAVSLSYTHIFGNSSPLTNNSQLTFTDINQIASVNSVMLGIIYLI